MVNLAAKIMSRIVSELVHKGMDYSSSHGCVTLPPMRRPMEWGEAVESLALAAVENRISSECGDIRRASVFVAHRILRSLSAELKEEKKRIKELENLKSQPIEEETQEEFYNPGNVNAGEPDKTAANPNAPNK